MKNLDWCIYTYKHRKAFEYCARKLIHDPALREEILRRAMIHDMDKMVMYLFMDQKKAQEMHTATQPHHFENQLERSYEDIVEAVIDYECAPYTKPDKPLNAYDFVRLLMDWKALDEKTGGELISVMEQFGIARSGTVEEDSEGLEYISSIGEVTEDKIYEEILRYVNTISSDELEKLLDKCKQK